MLSRKAEDYLKAILTIESEKGYARIKDIATVLDVTAPSVTEMAKKLDKEGYIKYVKYESITLTPKGVNIAKVAKNRYDLLMFFLQDVINVPQKIAEKDASMLENKLHDITIERISKFVSSKRQVL